VERHPVQTYGLAFPTPHGRRELLNRSTPTVDEDVAMNIGAPLIPLRLVDRFPSQQYPDRVFVQRNQDRFTRFGLVARHKAALSIPIDSFPEEPVELLAHRVPGLNERDAYERVLSDALARDRTLFAREDYVEEAWRIVDPVIKLSTPPYLYESGTWGPKEVESVAPPGGWQNPVAVGE
jgi:hypothetical protein